MSGQSIEAWAGPVYLGRLRVADGFGRRLVGLSGRRRLDFGLLLRPCNSIHTWFMRTEIDAIFVDANDTVLSVATGLKPWRLGPVVRSARYVIEVAAGGAQGVLPGAMVRLAPLGAPGRPDG